MRTASAALQAFLGTHTVGTWAHLVTITPRAGSVVYWTDYSSSLLFDGHTFLRGGEGTTAPTIEFGTRTEVAGTNQGTLDVRLACGTAATFNGVRLPVAAANRAFDGAIVKVERVFGEREIDLTMGALHVFEGIVMNARPTSTAVELDIESGLAALNVEIPRRCFQPSCTNIFGDAQCGISRASKTIPSNVTNLITPTTTTFSAWFAPGNVHDTGYYDLGVLTFDANTFRPSLRGVSRAVRKYEVVGGVPTFTLDRPLPVAPISTLDTFTVYPGCPKTLAACETKFGVDNRARFRGFPFVPRGTGWMWSYSGGLSGFVGERGEKEPDLSATYGKPIPIVYGKRRVGGEIVYLGSAASNMIPAEWAVCEGPIAGVDKVYRDTQTYAFNWDLKTGTRPTQTAWSQLPSGKDLTYPGVAILPAVAPIENGQVARYEWEVRGFLDATGGADDAHPADIIQDLFLNAGPLGDTADGFYGAGFPFAIETDTGLDGTAASSCRRYVAQETATGEGDQLWLSLYLKDKRRAIDVLEEICESINCEPLWKDGKLWIIPRQDTAVGTFTPVTSIRYAFTEADLVGGGNQDPVSVRIDPETEAFNICPVTFPERTPTAAATDATLEYDDSTEQDPDPIDVNERGERPDSPVRLDGITRRKHAVRISRILAQRQLRRRMEVKFSVPWRYALIEPLDLVTITDSLFPYTAQRLQVREVEEDMRAGLLMLTCACWEAGVNHATSYATQSSDGAANQWPTYNAGLSMAELAAANWTLGANPPGVTPDYRALASNGSRIAAVGASVAATSDNLGASWTARTIPAGTYESAVWDGAQFVAVGASVAATSPDGITWTSRTIPAGTYYAVGVEGSAYVAVGDGVAATSTNGTSWTSRTIGTDRYFALARGASTWVAVGYNGACSTSPDGVTWTPRTIPSGTYWAVVYDTVGGRFTAGGLLAAASSVDGGVTWAEVPGLAVGYVYAMGTSGGVTIAAGGVGAAGPELLMTTTDGDRWTSRSVAPAAAWKAITRVSSGNRWCIVGQLATPEAAYSLAAL